MFLSVYHVTGFHALIFVHILPAKSEIKPACMHIKSSHTQHYISTQAHLCKHCQAAEESQHSHDHWCASLLLHTERSCSPALQAWSSWHRCCHSAVVCMFQVGTGCSCRLNSPASSETLLCTGIWGFRRCWCSYLSRLQRGSL